MKQRLAAGLFAWATGLLLLFPVAEARADMCFGGGSHNLQPPQDAGAKDVAVEMKSPGKRRLGFGFLAAASVGTVWLSFRGRDSDKRGG